MLNGESTAPEREQVLKYLISKGLELLRNGANPNLKDKKYGLTPLGLALKLQAESKFPEDRRAVISALENR